MWNYASQCLNEPNFSTFCVHVRVKTDIFLSLSLSSISSMSLPIHNFILYNWQSIHIIDIDIMHTFLRTNSALLKWWKKQNTNKQIDMCTRILFTFVGTVGKKSEDCVHHNSSLYNGFGSICLTLGPSKLCAFFLLNRFHTYLDRYHVRFYYSQIEWGKKLLHNTTHLSRHTHTQRSITVFFII